MKRLAALLVAAALAWPALAEEAADEPLPAGIVARYLLRDVNGRAVTEGDFAGRFQLITFGYTYCPDICPTTLVEMTEVLRRLGDRGDQLQAIFVTVDPERDTPQALKTYTSHFDPRILGLSGSPELVRSAADRFKVRYEKVREPGAPADQYSVDHSAGMYLLGPDGAFAQKFAYGMPAAEVAERIRGAMAATGQARRGGR